MNLKKSLCLFMVAVVLFCCLGIQATATDMPAETTSLRATGNFHVVVSPGVIEKANTKLSLEAGEQVTIKAAYSPFSASVDIGLIDSSGVFHYFTAENGIFDETIIIETRGNYTFAIRNNSTYAVEVTGYVNY